MANQHNERHQQIALKKVSDVPETPDDPVQQIKVVEYGSGIAGHFLIVHVRYGGSRKDHEFPAYWDGSWLKSDSPGMVVNLRHNSDGDPGKALIDDTLQIQIDEPANSSYRKFFVLVEGGGAKSDAFDVAVQT